MLRNATYFKAPKIAVLDRDPQKHIYKALQLGRNLAVYELKIQVVKFGDEALL